MRRTLPDRRPALWLVLATFLLSGLLGTAPARAQPEVEELLREIESLLGGGRPGGLDPASLVAGEMPRVEQLSGLKALRPVESVLYSRAQLAEHVRREIERQVGPDRVAALEFAWKTMKLMGAGQSLEDELAQLYSAQAAGFYDPASGRLVLLEDLPPLLAVPVARHELVHALQDQHYDLKAWIGDAAQDEDRGAALQAVMEGHAMDVMNRSMSLDPRLLEQSPELAELLGDLSLEDLTSGGGSLLGDGGGLLDGLLPRSTPPALAAQLLFPYTVGARFVAGYRKTHPGDPSCSALYRRPPRTTAEVLFPELWESGFTPTLQHSGPPVSGFREIYGSALGQLLTSVLLTGASRPEIAGSSAASWGESDRNKGVVLGAGWRGDRVAVLAPKLQGAGSVVTDRWIVVWVSDWRDAGTAVRVQEALLRRVPGARTTRSGSRIKTVFHPGGLSPARIFRSLDSW